MTFDDCYIAPLLGLSHIFDELVPTYTIKDVATTCIRHIFDDDDPTRPMTSAPTQGHTEMVMFFMPPMSYTLDKLDLFTPTLGIGAHYFIFPSTSSLLFQLELNTSLYFSTNLLLDPSILTGNSILYIIDNDAHPMWHTFTAFFHPFSPRITIHVYHFHPCCVPLVFSTFLALVLIVLLFLHFYTCFCTVLPFFWVRPERFAFVTWFSGYVPQLDIYMQHTVGKILTRALQRYPTLEDPTLYTSANLRKQAKVRSRFSS